jgi:signal transduction histidine kinase
VGTLVAFDVPDRTFPRCVELEYVENHMYSRVFFVDYLFGLPDLGALHSPVVRAELGEVAQRSCRHLGGVCHLFASGCLVIGRLLVAHSVALSLGLVALVFAVDLSLPLGVASAVPYTFAVLLALNARPAWVAVAIAVLCGVLTIAKMEIVPERGTTEMWKVIANRCLALFAIGMTTLLGVLRRKAEAERQNAEEKLREHQADVVHMGRLSMLGQIATSLAHELNQPLAAVCLQADIAARIAVVGSLVGPELPVTLAEIAEQSSRAADIIKSIRRMAKRTEPGRDPVDVNDAVRGVVRLLAWQARRAEVSVELRLADSLGASRGDRVQIEQVVFNLLQNAIESVMERTGGPRTVTIQTTREADVVTVSVHDTGVGLADTEHVFERFYTTKPNGMGMGLAISRSIIEAHTGKLWARPADDGGAVFSFTLPVARREEL